MKRFLSATLLLLAFASTNALADNVRLKLYPNFGGGGNFEFDRWSATTSVHIIGGGLWPFFAYNGPSGLGYAPGSSLGGTTPIGFAIAYLTLGAIRYDLGAFGPGTLFMSPFTFPTDGKNFNAPVHLDFSASMYYTASPGGPLTPVDVGGSATGYIGFRFLNGGYYIDSGGFQTPEPSTWALFGTGVIGILAGVRKRKNPIS